MINWFRPAPEWRCESILQKPQPLKSWCAALVMNWRFAFVCKAALNVRPSLRNWIWQSIGKQSKTKRIIFKICCVFMCFLIVLLCAFWPRGHLLFFASPKKSKQKKGDPGCRFGYAKLPSLHMVLAALACRCAPDRPYFRQNHAPFGCAKGKAARIVRFRQPEQNSL